jgi:hypothetical protein
MLGARTEKVKAPPPSAVSLLGVKQHAAGTQ